jgi:hypothetical protein
MTIKYLSGDRVSGLSTDSKPTMADGSIFIETDTGKRFVKKVAADWEEVSGGNTVVPTAVTGLSTTVNSSSQITVSYTGYGNDGITGYKVEKRPSGGSWSTVSASTEDTSHAVTGLSTYTDYDFRVSAINSVGTSSAVTTSSLTKTQGIVPSVPTNFTTSVISTSQINLSWTASITGNPTPTYKIEYKLNSSGSWTELVASQAGTTYNKTGLSGYTEYDFRVSALNAQGTSNTISVTATRTSGVTPAQVTGLTLTDNKPNVGIVWSADSTGIPSVTYTLEHSLSSTFASGITVKASGGTGLSYTDSSVTQDVTHYYRVKAVNVLGSGTYSSISNIMIQSLAITTTGATVSTSGGYTYYKWTSNGTASIVGYTVDILLVGGGGGGGGTGNGNWGSGGGGGGGIAVINNWTGYASGSQTISVGSGGGGSSSSGGSGGGATGFGNITANGGGGGSRGQYGNGGSQGSASNLPAGSTSHTSNGGGSAATSGNAAHAGGGGGGGGSNGSPSFSNPSHSGGNGGSALSAPSKFSQFGSHSGGGGGGGHTGYTYGSNGGGSHGAGGRGAHGQNPPRAGSGGGGGILVIRHAT